MTIRSKSFFAERLREARQKASPHVNDRAHQLSNIAKRLHRDSPRSGPNRNKYGELRSGPGEAPAMEDGVLYALIDQGVHEGFTRAEVIVNYGVLEDGTLTMAPRPLGRQAADELIQTVKDEP